MPARNIYHDEVVKSLEADGWTITHDPLKIGYGGRDMYVDLGAERSTIGAQRGDEKIAVEVQSFLSPSPVRDLQEAVGRYCVYRAILAKTQPDRRLFMAVSKEVHETILSETFGQLIVTETELNLLVFDPIQERISEWIKSSTRK